MTKKVILTIITLSTFSIILSACSSSNKLMMDIENQPSPNESSPPAPLTTTPAADPSTLSDDQLLLQMESESDAEIDREFSRLDAELK